MDSSEVELEAAQPETSILVYQKYRGVAVYAAIVAGGAVLAVVGFVAGMRTSFLALILFLAGCLSLVGAILKLAMAIGDRKPVLVLAPRELVDARRPAYDQDLRWSSIKKMQVVHTFADGAEPKCTATLHVTKDDQPGIWRIELGGLDVPAKLLVELIQQKITASKS